MGGGAWGLSERRHQAEGLQLAFCNITIMQIFTTKLHGISYYHKKDLSFIAGWAPLIRPRCTVARQR